MSKTVFLLTDGEKYRLPTTLEEHQELVDAASDGVWLIVNCLPKEESLTINPSHIVWVAYLHED